MRPILLSVSAREGERGEPGFGTRLGLLCLGPALGPLYSVPQLDSLARKYPGSSRRDILDS